MIRVAINGFGRIGRLAARIILTKFHNQIELVAINTSGSMETAGWCHLLMNDTTYRRFEIEIENDQNNLIINSMGLKIPVLAERDPELLPWKELSVDVVLECTGKFTDELGALKHAKAGAKHVIISAPSKGGNVGTYVLGVNESKEGVVMSNASCTTNCITPVASVIHSKFGILKAMMTTVHAYTDDQSLQDASHKDLRRARAAAANIVPTSTGAAIATTEVIPELKGLFDGVSLRVPVITGSIADFVFLTKNKVTRKEINEALIEASHTNLKNILGISGQNGIPNHLVSSDIIGSSYSAIIDTEFTQVIDGDLVKILAWYDNEWGYANRLVEQVCKLFQPF
ncbi:type I glyceraldehyde-3-phosphate dehydrogenase [Candidatus Amesbacteria bacterium]|nr:type I glyceraldehyde-3-phosphate dehydrogenase [Candidatus Amesbacteria bacterium]